jgi:hypothetical protein
MKFRIGFGLAAMLFAAQAWIAGPATALPTPGQMGCAAVGCATAAEGLVHNAASRGARMGGGYYRPSMGGYRGGYRGGAYRGGAYRSVYRGGNRYYRGGKYYGKPGVRPNRAWNRRYARYPYYRNKYYRYGGGYYPYWGYGYGFGYYPYAYDPYYYNGYYDGYYGDYYGDGYSVYADVDPGANGYVDYCSRKYRSFNPRTGLYRTYSGRYKKCVYRG